MQLFAFEQRAHLIFGLNCFNGKHLDQECSNIFDRIFKSHNPRK